MQKRRVTISIGGVPCAFYSDDSAEYLGTLAQRANAAMRETAGFSGRSAYRNAVLSVLSVTDELLRTEQRVRELQDAEYGNAGDGGDSSSVLADRSDSGDSSSVLADRKNRPPVCRSAAGRRGSAKEEQKERDRGQISIWDILEGKQ
ncbi:MAG: cell division protein ZapA [Clostridia bacterium]|nr:cell division protein ZapA [Clostridia bacterium]